MFRSFLFLVFILIGGFAKAQIPLAEVKVNPTYTAWEVLEKARVTLFDNYDVKKTHNYRLFSQTIKDNKDTLLLINQNVSYKITKTKLFTYKISKVLPQIKDSLFFNKYENGYNWLQGVFYRNRLTTFLTSLYKLPINDSLKYELILEKIDENYKVSFITEREKCYWIINAKNFHVKEIFRQNLKMYHNQNEIRDSPSANPNKLIRQSSFSSSDDYLIFTTSSRNKILLKSVKHNLQINSFLLKVIINDKIKDQITFDSKTVFEMDLLE